jgi:predicted nucleic acid-binding Zn ribbon protein
MVRAWDIQDMPSISCYARKRKYSTTVGIGLKGTGYVSG